MSMRWRGSGSDLYAGGNFDFSRRHGRSGHCQMERDRLVGLGLGDKRQCLCAGGFGLRPVCGGPVHDGGRQRGKLHCQMEREHLVCFGLGDGLGCHGAGSLGVRPVCRGMFRMAGGSTAKGIARWDGSEWSALGSGMDYFVDALAVSGPDLYVGGSFTTAGDKVRLMRPEPSPFPATG